MFVFFNPNPDAKRVGDCTVRAIAKAMNTVWDMLKDAGGESEHMAIKKAISVLKNA